MVDTFTKFLCGYFFITATFCYANEKSVILNQENKDIIDIYLDEINLIGEANYSFLFWNIYDAQLYSSKKFNSNSFALILKYNKEIKKERLVKETINDMKDQKQLSKVQINNWTKLLNSIFQNIKVGSRFLAIKIDKKKSVFYYNEKKIFESSDQDFLNLFFNIWLRSDSKSPSFSKKLLGQVEN